MALAGGFHRNGNGAMVVEEPQQDLRLSGTTCSDDDELYFRDHPFTRHFMAAVHPLLISCSRQDVLSYFPHFGPRQQSILYEVFTLTITQIHKNIAAEFQSISKETKILEVLDHVDSKEALCAPDLRQSISPENVIREVALKRKQEEVNVMKQELQQVEEKNRLFASQLEGLREQLKEATELSLRDLEKMSNMNLNLQSAIDRKQKNTFISNNCPCTPAVQANK